jgi:quercetin dioxygenase-like cupin family protein
VLETAIVEGARSNPPGFVVIDGLVQFVRCWGASKAVAFFSLVCPRLFDLGAIAYWQAPRAQLGAPFIDEVTSVTQCVVEIGGGHLQVIKAEGRPASVQGRLLRLTIGDDGLHLEDERALGRLGHGLETVVLLSERLGIGVDDLLASSPPAGYVLARRPRAQAEGTTALLDDPNAGLRAYLVRLEPGTSGAPDVLHKGAEMVLVASGLVQLTIGSDTPVMRAGDAALATTVAVSGWRNLLNVPAVLFWVVRDNPTRTGRQ